MKRISWSGFPFVKLYFFKSIQFFYFSENISTHKFRTNLKTDYNWAIVSKNSWFLWLLSISSNCACSHLLPNHKKLTLTDKRLIFSKIECMDSSLLKFNFSSEWILTTWFKKNILIHFKYIATKVKHAYWKQNLLVT